MRYALVCLGLLALGCSSSDDSGGASGGAGTGAKGGTGGLGGSTGGTGAQSGAGGATGGTGGGGPVTVKPDNILNNGGFETGLMCWGNWIWSTTGQDYKGDYDFYLSTDAHSGSYSLSIKCIGSDCLKAAIYTNNISTPAAQAYKLSLWTKCPDQKQAAVYIPALSGGDFFQDVKCTGQWASNEFTFTSAGAGYFPLYVYNRDNGDFLVDDVVLTYADGTVPEQTIQHPGTRATSVSGTTLSVDGSPYLALGFFDVPYEDLEQVKSMNGNTVVALGGNTQPDCFNTAQQSYLDHAYELGIGVAPDSTTTARLDNAAVYGPVMDRFAPHLANVAWFLVDEPDQVAVSWYLVQPSTLVSEYQTAKTKTSLPILADMQQASWSTTDQVSPYAGAMDAWMAEPYGDDFGSVGHAVDMFNGIAKKPIWLAQDDVTENLIVPKAYFAVVKGSTGIIYFTWSELKKSGHLAAAQQAFTELGSLADAIFGTNIDSEVTAPPGVSYVARKTGGATYILAVNPTAQDVQGSFAVQGLTAGQQITVQFENRTLTASGGAFSDTFAGVARHVYVIK